MTKQPKAYIIFPLDLPSPDDAKRYVDLLSDSVGMFKIGLELFIKSGLEIIHFIQSACPSKIFLDLKLHDIPVTVKRAMEVISTFGVTFVTVHCGETQRMLEDAVAGSSGHVKILGVTVLTSVCDEDIQAAGFKEEFSSNMLNLVLKRAVMAKKAGCAGVVCSGLEVEMIKQRLGKDFIAVTPGIRPDWVSKEKDDQRRVATPAQAIRDGADYLVIGRPIRDARDPKAAALRIADEIADVL